MEALESHPSDVSVQRAASWALGELCEDSQERAAKAAELGALEPLVEALESHPSDVSVQRAASWALGELCEDSHERAAKAAELRVKADREAGETRPSMPGLTPERPIEAPAALIDFASSQMP